MKINFIILINFQLLGVPSTIIGTNLLSCIQSALKYEIADNLLQINDATPSLYGIERLCKDAIDRYRITNEKQRFTHPQLAKASQILGMAEKTWWKMKLAE